MSKRKTLGEKIDQLVSAEIERIGKERDVIAADFEARLFNAADQLRVMQQERDRLVSEHATALRELEKELQEHKLEYFENKERVLIVAGYNAKCDEVMSLKKQVGELLSAREIVEGKLDRANREIQALKIRLGDRI